MAEFALVIFPLLYLTVGTLDVGRLLWTAVTLHRAVNTIARCVSVDQMGTCDDVATFAALQAPGFEDVAFNVDPAAACGVLVSTSYTFNWILLPFGSVQLNPSACYTNLKSP